MKTGVHAIDLTAKKCYCYRVKYDFASRSSAPGLYMDLAEAYDINIRLE